MARPPSFSKEKGRAALAALGRISSNVGTPVDQERDYEVVERFIEAAIRSASYMKKEG